MPDTKENQKQWPQPRTQKKGCGFPVAKMLGVFCLAAAPRLPRPCGQPAAGDLAVTDSKVIHQSAVKGPSQSPQPPSIVNNFAAAPPLGWLEARGNIKRWNEKEDMVSRWMASGLLWAEAGFRKTRHAKDLPQLAPAQRLSNP